MSGGWDPEAGARRTVRLPALSAEQARRAEYFYPTAAQVAERVEKLRDRRRRIDARKAKLEEVKGTLLPEARQEYANVLEDTRHPANREAFPAEDLRRARDEAKAEVDRCVCDMRVGVRVRVCGLAPCCPVWSSGVFVLRGVQWFWTLCDRVLGLFCARLVFLFDIACGCVFLKEVQVR